MEAKGRWLGVIWNLKLIGAALIVTPILLAGSAWLGYSKGKQSGMQEVQTLWDSEKAIQLAAQAEAEMKARQTERAVQVAVNRVKQEKQREAIKLANDYAAVVNSLHNREDRPGGDGVPEGAGVGTGNPGRCTGAELYLSDSRFLAGEAVRADQLRLALRACKTAYDEVREQINARD
jgi:hypothetical protein